ncbi:MAG: response regulator transcription factor [Bacteroidota bacterium]
MTKLNLLIAEDQPIMVQGLKLIFEDREDIDVVEDVKNGREMVKYVRNSPEDIDIVLADIKMPDMDGLEAAKIIINSKALNTRILFYSIFITEAHVGRAIKMGVDGYLDKGCAGDEICKAIYEIKGGKRYYSEEVRKISKSAVELMENMPSKREWQVVKEVEKGLLDKEIGEKLDISQYTVSDHIKNLRNKYGANNRTELLYFLRNKGLI